MMQSRTDSLMEAVVNVIIGLIISTAANHVVLPAVLNVHMTLAENLLIGVIFTIISIARSYTLRRLFNGKSAWVWLKGKFPLIQFRRQSWSGPVSKWARVLHIHVGKSFIVFSLSVARIQERLDA